ncbi:MAG: DUF167 domain-containing protein [Fimbriimonadaceae bacterium]|nr:DUF167 domain-containing protein [Fimbriimonadaceae bacterium]
MGEVAVRVTPRSSRNRVEADGDTVRVWVNAAPTDGEANAAVCELLAKALGVPKSSVSVVRGQTSRSKRLRVDGVPDQELRHRLGAT